MQFVHYLRERFQFCTLTKISIKMGDQILVYHNHSLLYFSAMHYQMNATGNTSSNLFTVIAVAIGFSHVLIADQYIPRKGRSINVMQKRTFSLQTLIYVLRAIFIKRTKVSSTSTCHLPTPPCLTSATTRQQKMAANSSINLSL